MPARRLSAAVSPILRLVDWIFASAASGTDLFLFLGALWWLLMMLFRPAIFNQLPLVGMAWAPDAFWITFVSVVAAGHLAALARPGMLRLRMAVASASAWYWLTVAASLSLHGLTTGSGFYTLTGLGAAALAVYVSGRDAHRA